MLSQKIKSKKVELSLDQKREICNFFNKNTSIKQTQFILKFNNQFNMLISESILQNICSLMAEKMEYFYLYDQLNAILRVEFGIR